MRHVYLDHSSTTPLRPEVVEAMRPFLGDVYANPASGHDAGVRARDALERARTQVAGALGCDADEIVFTGGSSEANNLAVKGVAWASRGRGRHIVHSAVEHASIRASVAWLAQEGWSADAVGVDAHGAVCSGQMCAALRDDTVLCALMTAQNEVGTVMPVAAVAAGARERGVVMLTDASQAVGKIPVDVRALGVDLCVVAPHKLYGPKGVGVLYVKRGTALVSLVHGVAHEDGRRAGTVNLAGIVGAGVAIERAVADLDGTRSHLLTLRTRLLEGLRAQVAQLRVSGHPENHLPGTLHVCIPDLDSSALLRRMPHIAASNGATCQWGVTEPSATLTAMGIPRALALGAIRFSLGVHNTLEEMDFVVGEVVREVAALRGAAPQP